jgi:HAD superfamily hydrolase (TIGR01509 family)
VSAPAQLVIFDCDGVLVDTERLSVSVDARVLAHLGLPMSQDEIIERFVGRTETYWRAEIQRLLARPLAAGEFEAFDPWYREAFAAELTPIDHVVELLDALDALGIRTCVASSGTHERMRFTLGHTGLYDRFAGRIFSATEVAEGKPSPLLFEHAAEQMATPAPQCLVIEDSRYGVQAAVAAQMPVVGFSGSVTSAEILRDAGADHVVVDLREVLPIVAPTAVPTAVPTAMPTSMPAPRAD